MKNQFKPIRKTAFMMFKNCPKQFEFFYNSDNYNNYNEYGGSPALIRGQAFHKGVDEFFDKLQNWHYFKEDLTQIHDTTEEISKKFRTLLPNTNDDLVNSWFDFFANYEAIRFNNLREKNQLKYYMPLAREIAVTSSDIIDRSGHIDRIDIIPDTNNAQIVEYKTGYSYNMEKPDRVTKMNAEIGFYVSILQNINKFPEYNIVGWKVINPTLEKVWTNKLSKQTFTAVDKAYKRLTEMITTKETFDRNITDLCQHCPFQVECFKDIRLGINLEEVGKSRRLFT